MDGEKKDDIQKDIQWHPAFVSAMNLELAENREDLVFEWEYNSKQEMGGVLERRG